MGDWWDAASQGDVPRLTQLLESGHSVDAQDENGLTALHLATLHNSVSAVVLLLTHGANPSHQEARWGGTPLHRAAINGEVELARALLAAKAQTSARYPANEWTPLHEAAKHGWTRVAAALLEAGAAGDALTRERVTPLELAQQHGHAQTQALLRSWTPLNALGALERTAQAKALERFTRLQGERGGSRPWTSAAASGGGGGGGSSAVLPEDAGVLLALLVAALVPLVISRLCCCLLPRRGHVAAAVR